MRQEELHSNSLAKYGDRAIPHLVQLFKQESNWLIRQSIFAVINELNSPDLLWELSRYGLDSDDMVVKLTSITNLGKLSNTEYEEEAVNLLFDLSTNEIIIIRIRVAKVLSLFDHPKAKAALAKLRHDSNHRVVAATLESMISDSDRFR